MTEQLDHNSLEGGIVRSSSATLRKEISVLKDQVEEERALRIKAEADARFMAAYLQNRVSLSVWDHVDVMAMVHDLSTIAMGGVVNTIERAKGQGVPLTYTLVHELVVTRFDAARANVLNRIGYGSSQSAVASPELVTDRMKEDLSNATRLPQ